VMITIKKIISIASFHATPISDKASRIYPPPMSGTLSLPAHHPQPYSP
jgi:hypothetical protein